MRPHPDACFDLQFCHGHLCNYNPQIVNTNNRATTGFLISKLWVKTRTLRTGNRVTPTPQIPQSWKKVFFHICRVGIGLFRKSDFAVNFCFNSKPSFSFDSIGQWNTFPVTSTSRCNHKKGRFRVKTSPLQNIVANIARIGLESKRHHLYLFWLTILPLPSRKPKPSIYTHLQLNY